MEHSNFGDFDAGLDGRTRSKLLVALLAAALILGLTPPSRADHGPVPTARTISSVANGLASTALRGLGSGASAVGRLASRWLDIAPAGADTAVTFDVGETSTFAGDGSTATVDGTGSSARFKDMGGTVVVGSYAYQLTAGAIRKVNLSTGAVSTLVGDANSNGCTDSSVAANVRLGGSGGGVLATDGTSLYFTDPWCSSFQIRKTVIATGATSLLATSPGRT